MIQPLIIDNNLSIKYLDIEYTDWKSLNSKFIKNIYSIINTIIWEISYYCNKNSIITSVKDVMYIRKLQELYYFLLHINNQFTYNNYIEYIKYIHNKNIEYDSIIIEQIENKSKVVTKRTKNKYYKNIVTNLFTNEIEYDYINPVTGDKISSKDPDLLKTLNNKTKVKRTKISGVPLSSMSFSFKIKK